MARELFLKRKNKLSNEYIKTQWHCVTKRQTVYRINYEI